ncbi:MAG: DNA cytosine methyltransferase [Candidatus Goldbacteria bacterium]|nr:DNA cytosine methyltransferase [Candidatus Goldiibacteriota bacterium]
MKKKGNYKQFLSNIEDFLANEEHEKLASVTHYYLNKGTDAEKYYKNEAKKILEHAGQLELFKADMPITFPFSPPKEHKFTFIDLFAGVGGMRIGFQNAGGRCVFTSEWDRSAQLTYKVNFGEVPFGDITRIDAKCIPEHDVLVAGFPCQPFSIAGYKKGFEDKGRGNLFFDIVRILKEKQPKSILLENVKNLKGHDKGRTFEVISKELKNAGYFITSKVLNTMEYADVPQNRERIYIVGFLDENNSKQFKYPEKIKRTKQIHDCLEKKIDTKYYYNDKTLYPKLIKDITKNDTVYQWRRKYVRENKNKVCPTLTANMGMGGHNVPLILDKDGIRKITPRECANFQGFPKKFVLPSVADSHLYKQFGNSVSVPVIEKIAESIVKAWV